MKFAFIAPRLHPNMQYQIKALQEAGHEVNFFSLYHFTGEDYGFLKPVELGYSRLFSLVNRLINKKDKLTKNYFELKYGYPPVWKFIYKLIKAKPDALIIKNIESVYSLLALAAGRILRKKLIVILSVEKYREQPRSGSVYWAGRLFNAEVITPLLGDTRYKNENDNLYYVPFPHPASDFKKEYFRSGRINIISVGKFSKRKEQLLLLKAVNELKDKYRLHATLVGQKDEADYLEIIERYIKDNRLENLVKIKFDLPWQDVYKEYDQSDVFILPAYNEMHSYAAMEAMSRKLPVIVSDSNGIKWYIKEGTDGYVIKKGDLGDLIEKLELIIADRGKLMKMGQAGFEKIRDKYLLKMFSDNLLAVIKRNK